MTAELGNQLSKQLQGILTRVPDYWKAASPLELFLVIVVIVYLLLKGEGLWNGIFEWLPGELGRRLKTTLPRSFRNFWAPLP